MDPPPGFLYEAWHSHHPAVFDNTPNIYTETLALLKKTSYVALAAIYKYESFVDMNFGCTDPTLWQQERVSQIPPL